MKCDQDLCLNFWYDLRMLLWQDELNPRVRCAFGNVYLSTIYLIFDSQTRKYFSGLKVLFLASRTHFGVWFCDLFELQIKLCIYELN